MNEFIDLDKKDDNKFSIFNYIKLISSPTIILFFISFIFIFYSINKIVEGIFFIIISSIFIYIINYLNKNNIPKKDIYEILLLFLVILYSVFLINLTFTFIILFVLIQAFFYYKIKKKHNIKTIFFTFFIGSIFTYALVSIIFKSERYYKLLNKIINNYAFLNETIIINLILLLIYLLITFFLLKVINKELELFLKYLQSISIIIFGLFIVSIVFLLNFFTGEFINSVIVFVLLLLQFLILDLLYKKNKIIFTKIFGIIIIIFTLFLMIYYKTLLLFILFLIAFVNSLFYYYKSNNKDNLRYVFLNELISITFAITITSFFIIIYSNIVELFELINFLTILISIIPLLIILFSSYLIISIYLIKKTIGFEYDAYFKFKHIPFSIFNILSSKIDNIKKSIIYRTIFYTIASFIIVSLYLTSISFYFANNYINEMYVFDLEECHYEYINPLEEIIKSKYAENEFYKYNPLLFYNLDEYHDYIKTNNISIPKISYFKIDNDFIYDGKINNKDILINYNCNTNLECKTKQYDNSINISKLAKHNYCTHNKKPVIVSVENKTKKSIYILPNISFEDKLNFYLESRIDDNFFEIKELINTQYINELKRKHSDLFELKYINYNINNKPKFKERIKMTFFNDIYYDYYNFSKNYYIEPLNNAFITEYNWIKENEINNTPFYDNTTTKKEHIKKLRENIEILYNKIDFELNYRQRYDYKIYEPKLFSKIIEKFLFQTIYGKLKNENMMIIHNQIENEYIIETYNNLDVKEDELSKIIRLKRFEDHLIRHVNRYIINNCNINYLSDELKYNECINEVNNNYKLINNKEFCKKDINNELYNTCFEPIYY